MLQRARVKRQLDRLSNVRGRAAVGGPEEAVLLQATDVPSDGHFRNSEFAGKLADLDRLPLGNSLQNPAPPVNWEHAGPSLLQLAQVAACANLTDFNTLHRRNAHSSLVAFVQSC